MRVSVPTFRYSTEITVSTLIYPVLERLDRLIQITRPQTRYSGTNGVEGFRAVSGLQYFSRDSVENS